VFSVRSLPNCYKIIKGQRDSEESSEREAVKVESERVKLKKIYC
jgi:hypothetical protein